MVTDERKKYLVRRFRSALDHKLLWWAGVLHHHDDDEGNKYYSWRKCSESWEDVIQWIQHREMTRNK